MIAEELHGGHIGTVIAFDWAFFSSGVRATVIGELRQINHVSGQTIVNLTDPNGHSADLTEFELHPDAEIRFDMEIR